MNGTSVAELQSKYGVMIPAGSEVVKWPVYDYQTYAQAGQTGLTFFNTVPTNKDLGNMEAASAFPAPKKYFLRGICVHFIPAQYSTVSKSTSTLTDVQTAINDTLAVLEAGHLELLIGNKQYLFGAKLGLFPTPIVFQGFSSVHFTQTTAANQVNNTGFISNGVNHRDTFMMDPPILIDSQINFQIDLKWNTAVAVSAAGTIGVILLGQLIRPIQ